MGRGVWVVSGRGMGARGGGMGSQRGGKNRSPFFFEAFFQSSKFLKTRGFDAADSP
jgi:hypothetical protein